MSRGLLAINIFLHDSVLVNSNRRQHIERLLVARVDPIEYQTYNDLLPCWTPLVPEFRLLQVDNVANILHDTVERTGGEYFVLVVIGDRDEQFRVTIVHGGAKVVAILDLEIIGIAGGSGIYQWLAWVLGGDMPVAYISCA